MSNVFTRGSRPSFKEMMRLEPMSARWMHRLGYYGLALLFVAAAAALRWALPEVLGPTPFLAFYLAWVGAAAFGGLGPGLLATLASWLCLEVLFNFTPGQTIFGDPMEVGRFLVLLAGGLTVSLVAERMRRGRIYERQQARELADLTHLTGLGQFLIRDDEDRIVFWSEGCARFYGFTAERAIGCVSHELLQTEFHQPPETLRAKLYEAGRWEGELAHRRADGSVVYVASLWVLRGNTVLEVDNDITDRKRAEEAIRQANEQLQQQAEELQTQTEELQTQTEELAHANAALHDAEERLRLAMESGKVGVWEWEVGTKDAKWSQGVYMLLGCKPGEVAPTQEAFRQRIHPQDLARQDQALKDSLERCEDYLCEFRVVWADGSVHWIEARGQYAYVDEGNGKILWLRGVLSDIDRRKRAEEALRELNAALESKVAQRTAQLQQRAKLLQRLTLEASQTEDRERKRMAEILHDDLQQIIAGAKFHLSLLRNRVQYDPSVQAIAAQVDGMLKDAIEKSRGLSHELSPAILYQGDFAETLGWLAKQMQAKHGLVVHVHAHGPSHVPSEAIKTFLYKTAQELLFNVVKHARVKEAGIRVRRRGPCVCLLVSDRGRGFDPQGLREAPGFGLLSIRERIELLGGRMKIRSAAGKGSTFFIVVPDSLKSEDTAGVGRVLKRDISRLGSPPRAYPPSATPGDHGGKEGGHGGPPLRVLLADDHRIVREGLRLLLSDEPDVEIVGEAAHGREAVDLALRLEPDVVIMDVSMPLIDGDEATRQIKEHLPGTRVIALSTYNKPETIEKMYKAGAESYVLKTASPEELLTAIRGKEPDSRKKPA